MVEHKLVCYAIRTCPMIYMYVQCTCTCMYVCVHVHIGWECHCLLLMWEIHYEVIGLLSVWLDFAPRSNTFVAV